MQMHQSFRTVRVRKVVIKAYVLATKHTKSIHYRLCLVSKEK